MYTGKITSIELKNEWTNPKYPKDGPIYYQEYVVENTDGTIITGTAGTKNKNKYPVGSTIEYTTSEQSDKQGNVYTKIEPIDPEKQNFKSGGGNSNYNKGGFKSDGVGMMVGNAITNATLLVSHSVITLDELESIADRICEISIRLKAKHENK
jgi:hypothetical protein